MSRAGYILVLVAVTLGVAGLAAQVAPATTPPPSGSTDRTSAEPTATSRPQVDLEDFWERAQRGVPRQQSRDTGPRAPGTSARDLLGRDRELQIGPMPSTPRVDDPETDRDRRSRNWLFEAIDQAEDETRGRDRDRDRDRSRDRDADRERDRDRDRNPLLGPGRDSSASSSTPSTQGERLSLMDLVRQEESRQRNTEARRQDRDRDAARKADEVSMEAPPSAGDTSSGAGSGGSSGSGNASANAEDPARLFAEGDALARLHQRLLFGSDAAAEAARSRAASSAWANNPYMGESASRSAAASTSAAEATWAAATAVAARGTAGDGAGRFRSLESEERARRAVSGAAAGAVSDLRPEERVTAYADPGIPLLPVDIRDPGISGGWAPPPMVPVVEDRRNYRPEAQSDNERFFPQIRRF